MRFPGFQKNCFQIQLVPLPHPTCTATPRREAEQLHAALSVRRALLDVLSRPGDGNERGVAAGGRRHRWGCTHSRVSDQIGYVGYHIGCHQLCFDCQTTCTVPTLGTGVVPLIGLVQARATFMAWNENANLNTYLPPVKLVLVCRDAADVAMLRKLRSHLLGDEDGEQRNLDGGARGGRNLSLSVIVHYTGNEDIATVHAASRLALRRTRDTRQQPEREREQEQKQSSSETQNGKGGNIHVSKSPRTWSADSHFQMLMLVVGLHKLNPVIP
jgi:hypothetical protein